VSTRSLLLRLVPPGLVVAGVLAVTSSAAGAPTMCTTYGADPQGVTATHLLAKIDGAWVEPKNVCVAVRMQQSGFPGGHINRAMFLHIWNTVDPAFPETHLPPDTPLSLGIRRPPGTIFDSMAGGWRDDGIAISDATDTVIQARTVPWDYHHEAYFGSGLDCSIQPSRWPST
jgi:hypothetical protein